MSPIITSKLERLDIPGKGGVWRFFQGMSDAVERRKEFRRLVANDRHKDPETLPKLRTLIDLGLWNDFLPEEGFLDGIPEDDDAPSLAKQFGNAMRGLFGNASLAYALRTPEEEARIMFSSLEWGAKQGIDMDVLHLALEAGLDPDTVVDGAYNHHLMAHQAYHGHNDQALKLFKAGANPRLQALTQDNVAHILAGRGSIKDMETLRQMVEGGLDINDPGKFSKGFHHVAMMVYMSRPRPAGELPPIARPIANGNLPAVKDMVGMGATLDWDRETAFHLFIRETKEQLPCESLRFMEAMLEWGAPIDEKNGEGITPLWYCVPHHPEQALWLIEHGARVDIKIHWFEHWRSPDRVPRTLMEHLISQGADFDAWKAVVEQIQKRFPDCWGQPCSKAADGFLTVADLVMHRGGPWGAMASACWLEKRVDTQDDDTVKTSRPRF